jgi:2-polyprenyl-3-methyl-5-hydroxy-6-metoxy-1,4-benzoquinol methylase
MGEGRNAIFLAQQGWQVTGVDISDVAVAQARSGLRNCA